MEIKSKYNIGDVVFCPVIQDHNTEIQCPDCNGEHWWIATTRNGREVDIQCPTCYYNKQYKFEYLPFVKKLTIGSVRFNSADDNKYTYMCLETGVGSGNVYDEEKTFSTEDLAMECAKKLAAEKNKEREENKKKNMERLYGGSTVPAGKIKIKENEKKK